MTRSKHGARKPRPVHANPFVLARNMATALTAVELAQISVPVRAAFDRLRRGRAGAGDWCVLAGSLMLARNVERQGVVRGLAEHLARADAALAAIEARASAGGAWRAPTLYADEIDAIDVFVDVHLFQLGQLSYGEFRAAYKTTDGQARTRGVTVETLEAAGP